MADNADPAGELTLVLDDDVIDIEDDEAAGRYDPPASEPVSAARRAILLGSAITVALAVLVGWLGFRAYQSENVHTQRSQFLQAARQAALNLTNIDWQHADADVQRILDGATGQFHDDFSARAQPFVDLVKKAKSITVGKHRRC